MAHRAARAAFPMHLKMSAMHGGDESESAKALQDDPKSLKGLHINGHFIQTTISIKFHLLQELRI